ncbi:ATP-dependent DNA helicase [Methylobacterium gnaphalii]|uniref:ATP-binding protein n=1 Tax=Methylobacterium gnaphalii TaxID=1010610 RepID=A0A512JIR2_9HYPH|nr:ATP-dependent RecD-like DNA helicase [Methylobacterium gnaphalii]GEP09847.1 ATP-binding protein [Methylobacterium gnaphalii]GJD67238.1 ATP-dependent RecD-like DNA helicase [Methylobacterium gnaphalii]GLS49876.1 ATP-binding protein [Methylobacterium gnaphalii]
MTWSPQQDQALQAIADWHQNSDDQVFYLAGYAGTGKTTLAKEIASGISGTVLFAAFTGKAALVLQGKGCTGARTIHSLIYNSFEEEILDDKTGEVVRTVMKFGLNPLSEVDGADLVVIDECSMVDERLGKDLLSFGTPLLVLGDPAQLPPVRGAGFFTSVEPDFMLTEIHRQAADNPIIRMSMEVRQGRHLQVGSYGESRVITGRPGQRAVMEAEQVLVGRNDTRRTFNAKMRALQGRRPGVPETGDRLVCLKNNKELGLLNGGLWTVDKLGDADGSTFKMSVSSNDVPGHKADIRVPEGFFSGREEDVPYEAKRDRDEFTFGYALTVHKAQGSQWKDVLLVDESSVFREDRARHLYTGLTRAAERVTVVVP